MINILVVEDDSGLNQAVCTYLNDSDFHAKGCLNANDAYDAMYNSLFDLIISDIISLAFSFIMSYISLFLSTSLRI